MRDSGQNLTGSNPEWMCPESTDGRRQHEVLPPRCTLTLSIATQSQRSLYIVPPSFSKRHSKKFSWVAHWRSQEKHGKIVPGVLDLPVHLVRKWVGDAPGMAHSVAYLVRKKWKTLAGAFPAIPTCHSLAVKSYQVCHVSRCTW